VTPLRCDVGAIRRLVMNFVVMSGAVMNSSCNFVVMSAAVMSSASASW
jgi:hypothetical protein